MSRDSADGAGDVPCEWNMSTSEEAPCSTWPLGTFAAVGSWVDARTRTGIDSFGRLVDQVMRSEPYRSASRVFLGRGQRLLSPRSGSDTATAEGLS